MNLKEELLELTNGSESNAIEECNSEKEDLIDLLKSRLEENASEGSYSLKFNLSEDEYPAIHYLYLGLIGAFDMGRGLFAFKSELVRLLDDSLTIDVNFTANPVDYDEINVRIFWMDDNINNLFTYADYDNYKKTDYFLKSEIK